MSQKARAPISYPRDITGHAKINKGLLKLPSADESLKKRYQTMNTTLQRD